MADSTVFRVNDPVHGSIEIEGKEICLIINTPEFQRLRKIKQLGGKSYVYPGANHTRFEHSIGVCYIASELLKHLEKFNKDYYISTEDTGQNRIRYDLCVKIAALCHDLGHGPFSHLYDTVVKNKLKELNDHDSLDLDDRHHEYRSVKILERVLENKKEYPDITAAEIGVIGNMITFSKNYKVGVKLADLGIPDDKAYFYEIVANGFTGIDVDKMDYFIRDGHAMGLSSSFDWKRYIQTLKILPVDGPEGTKQHRLCSRDKEAPDLYQLFHIRNQLHRQGYQHKTSLCIERMIGEALVLANDGGLKIFAPGETDGISILQAWKNIDAFLHLTDTIEDTIMQQTTKDQPQPNLTKARSLFIRIRKRKLWKFIGEVKEDEEVIEPLKKKLKDAEDEMKADDEIQELRKELKVAKLLKKNEAIVKLKETLLKNDTKYDYDYCIVHEEGNFSYGMDDKDPITHHWFYDKLKPNEPYQMKTYQVSCMLPKTFSENKVFFYYKPPQDFADSTKELQLPLYGIGEHADMKNPVSNNDDNIDTELIRELRLALRPFNGVPERS